MMIGRSRSRPPWMMAAFRSSPSLRSWLMRSIRTIALLTTTPARITRPISLALPRGWFASFMIRPTPMKANGHREQDRERVDEALEQRRHDHVDQQQREQHGEPGRSHLGLGGPEVAPEVEGVARRQLELGEHPADGAHHRERPRAAAGVDLEHELGAAILALDGLRSGDAREAGEARDRERRRRASGCSSS